MKHRCLFAVFILGLLLSGCGLTARGPATGVGGVGVTEPSSDAYPVEQYAVPGEGTGAPIYAATVTAEGEPVSHLSNRTGEEGIWVFSHVDNPWTGPERMVWYPVYIEGSLVDFEYLNTRLDGTTVQGFLSQHYGYDFAAALAALAERSSAEAPMYLVHDDIFYYAVVGGTAFCLSETPPPTEYLPPVHVPEGLSVICVQVDDKDDRI